MRVLPAHERLVPDHAGVGQVDDRLVVDHELVLRDGRGELAVQVRRRAHGHRRVVDLGPAAARTLGPVERRVGGGEQARRSALDRVRVGEGDPDAGRDVEPSTTHADRLLQPGVDGAGDLEHRARTVEVLHDDDELVAAEPRHGAPARGRRAQHARDVHEHLVTGGVAVAVVDLLEPVEVARQDRDPVDDARLLEHRLEDLLQQRAVGQPGERVVHRPVREHLGLQPRLRGVAHLDDEVVGRAGRGAHERGVERDPHLVAVGSLVPLLEGEPVLAAAEQAVDLEALGGPALRGAEVLHAVARAGHRRWCPAARRTRRWPRRSATPGRRAPCRSARSPSRPGTASRCGSARPRPPGDR